MSVCLSVGSREEFFSMHSPFIPTDVYPHAMNVTICISDSVTRPTCVASEYGVFDDVETFIERKTSWRSMAVPGAARWCRFILTVFGLHLQFSSHFSPRVVLSFVLLFLFLLLLLLRGEMALLAFLVVGLFCVSSATKTEAGEAATAAAATAVGV